VNTVVNAFYYLTLVQMSEMAAALEKPADAEAYRAKAAGVKAAFHRVLFDGERGV